MAKESGDQILFGFISHALEATQQGMNYTEFVSKTETDRKDANAEALRLRRLLDTAPSGQVYFDYGVALSKMRREGEALVNFQKALELDPDAPFKEKADFLIDYIEKNDRESAQAVWLDILEKEKNAPRTKMDDIPHLWNKILELRTRALAGDEDVDEEIAVEIMKIILEAVHQLYGVDLFLADDWFKSEMFPFTRHGIFGPGLADQYDCTCPAETPAQSTNKDDKCVLTIAVETWRFVTHSYSLVGQQFLLGLLAFPQLCVYMMNPPYLERHWRPAAIGASQSSLKDNIVMRVPMWSERPPGSPCPDVVIRSYWPLDTKPFPCEHTKTIVFGATEFKRAPNAWLKELGFWNETSAITLITPSQVRIPSRDASDAPNSQANKYFALAQWSAMGFVNDGVDPEMIRILPHGIDESELHPTVVESGAELIRDKHGWDSDTLVFLHVSSMADRKGLSELVSGFNVALNWFQNRCAPFRSDAGRAGLINFSRRLAAIYRTAKIHQRASKTLSSY